MMIIKTKFNKYQENILINTYFFVVRNYFLNITRAFYFLFFKKRIIIIMRKIKQVITLTNETNLIVVDVITKKTRQKTQHYINYLDNLSNMFNFNYDYNYN